MIGFAESIAAAAVLLQSLAVAELERLPYYGTLDVSVDYHRLY